MNRRKFLASALAMPLVGAAPGLRSITYNVLACGGFPKTKENTERLERAQPQMLDRYALELTLYRPDIVSFSESVTRPDAEKMADRLGLNFAYFEPGVPRSKGIQSGFRVRFLLVSK